MLIVFHLVRSLFGAFFKITLTALIMGAVFAGGALLVAYHFNPVWPPTTLTEITAGVIGVLAAYASGLTVLLREALHAAFALERGVIQGVEHELETLEREASGPRS
ncbi:MAG TPA: hypothetical protein VF120_01220 [Ktedonobacterales bacterium]